METRNRCALLIQLIGYRLAYLGSAMKFINHEIQKIVMKKVSRGGMSQDLCFDMCVRFRLKLIQVKNKEETLPH